MTAPRPHNTTHLRAAPWLLAGLFFVTIGYQATRYGDLERDLDRMESSRQSETTRLRSQLEGVQGSLGVIRDDLRTASLEAGKAEILAQRLAYAENRLGTIGEAVEAHSSSLTTLEETTASFDTLERELDARDERLLRQWEALSDLVSSTRETAEESQRRLEVLSETPDLRVMWRELVGPVVQLAGDTSVGSGVMLQKVVLEGSEGHVNHLITAWHVVRDIQGDLSKTDMPVPVRIYAEDGTMRDETASLLAFDAELDAALLEIRTADGIDNGATMATRERLGSIKIFDQIFAVGCPLGNDPIPTRGEIATYRHEVDGELYWMINAPTYIGNSGGGIFDSETHELLGIFSKIYTHGSLRPTIVPHMGLVTPLDAIYDWLETQGYAQIIPGPEGQKRVAAAD